MDAIELASNLTLVGLVLLAVYQDIRFWRIRNRLIGIGYVLALGFTLLQKGPDIAQFLLGISFPVVLLFILFVIRVLGAGDIKLFSMIGGFINFKELLWCMGLSFVLGAIYALFLLLQRESLRLSLKEGLFYVGDLMWGRLEPYQGREKQENLMHFSIPICLALIIVKGVMKI